MHEQSPAFICNAWKKAHFSRIPMFLEKYAPKYRKLPGRETRPQASLVKCHTEAPAVTDLVSFSIRNDQELANSQVLLVDVNSGTYGFTTMCRRAGEWQG